MSATLSHSGLPDGIKRTKFIDLVRPALKARGLRTSAITYLARAFENWTRNQDYEPDRISAFWHEVSELAEFLSCTVRTIHIIEADLIDAGLISKHLKANGKRDGVRLKEGEKVLLKVFGVNLAPIVEQASELLAEAEAIRLHEKAKDQCRREIRQINLNIRKLNSADAVDEARKVLPDGRSAIIKSLAALEEIRDALSAVELAFETEARSEKSSVQTEENDLPIIQTKQSKFLYRSDEVTSQVTARQAIFLATEEFQECLSWFGDYSWRGITNAAYEIARSMGIEERTWRYACKVMGPERAALCIILIHRNQCLPSTDRNYPRKPGACFGGMIKKARNGSFNLLGFLAISQRNSRLNVLANQQRGALHGR